jgi:WD40 repeat protein
MECLVGSYTELKDDIDYSIDSCRKAVERYQPPRYRIKLADNPLTAIEVNVKHNIVYVGDQDGGIHAYNKKNSTRTSAEIKHKSYIRDLLLIDQNRLLSSNQDGILDIWDPNTLEWKSSIKVSENPIIQMLKTPNNKSICTASDCVSFYDTSSLELTTSFPFHTLIQTFAISPEMNYFIICSSDLVLYKYCIHQRQITSVYSSSVQNIIGIIISQQTRQFVALDIEGCLSLWDMESFKMIRVISISKYKGNYLYIPDCETWALTTYKDKTMKVWCLLNECLEMKLEFNSNVGKLLIMKDKEILCCKENGELEVIGLQVDESEMSKVEMHDDWVQYAASTQDSKTTFTACRDGTVFQHNFPCFDTVNIFNHPSEVNYIAVSHDDKYIFCSCLISQELTTIYIWDLSTSSLHDTLSNISSTDFNICISSDTKYLLTKSSNSILFYNLINKMIEFQIKTHSILQGAFLLTPDDKYILAANADYQILIYDYANHKELGVLEGHSDTINSIVTTRQNFLCFSAGDDGNLNTWNLSCKRLGHTHTHPGLKIKSLALSNDDRFLFAGFHHRMVYIISIEERTAIKKIRLNSDYHFTSMKLSFSDTYIIFTSYKSIYYTLNPLKSDKLTINKRRFSAIYINYLKNLYLNSKTPYNKFFNAYRVLPYNINALHVLASTSNIRSTKQALRDRIPFTKSKNNETAISICLNKNNKQCADAILKRLPKYDDDFKYKLGCILEDYIIELTQANLPSISKLFNIIFIEVEDSSLDKFGYLTSQPPILHESRDPYINQLNFVQSSQKHKDLNNEEPLAFKQTCLRFNLSLGSSPSIKLLKSLINCEDSEVFRTPLAQAILLYKWRQVSRVYIFMTCIYSFYILVLVLYICSIIDPFYSIIFFLVQNIFFGIMEFMQMLADGKSYFTDMWNLLDISRIFSIFLYCIEVYVWNNEEYNKYLLCVIIILSWGRFISVFRIFSSTRYLIRIIIEVIKDMIPFMFILSTGTLAISLLFYEIEGNKKDMISCILQSYRIAYGDYDVENYTNEKWVVFIVATVINPLIMMNLLISIMGDTYSRVQDLQAVADSKELGSMILEVEPMLFWNRSSGDKMFLQQCSISEDSFLDGNKAIQGRIRELKNTLKLVSEKQKDEEKMIQRFNQMHIRSTDGINNKIKDLSLVVNSIKSEMNDLKIEVDFIRKQLLDLPNKLATAMSASNSLDKNSSV